MCAICRTTPCHSLCPNYIPPRAIHYCSVCGEGIYEGEEYIVNEDDDYRHYDCSFDIRDLVEWLGYNVKTMERD